MCDQIKNASIEWQDERTPISKKFDDPYFSVFDGLEETRHVFCQEITYINASKMDFM